VSRSATTPCGVPRADRGHPRRPLRALPHGHEAQLADLAALGLDRDVLGPDGARLAKRHGAVTLADRRALGEDPAQVRALLAATVGLAAPGEVPTPEELVRRFDPAALPVAATALAA
jgi:hypothetical protein